MVNSDKCQRCDERETFKHLLWECVEAKKVWNSYNQYLEKIDYPLGKIQNYEDIFTTQNLSPLSTVKMKIIQEMIQIIRPVEYSMDRVENIAKEMRNIELYNAMSINNLEKTKKKWIKIT